MTLFTIQTVQKFWSQDKKRYVGWTATHTSHVDQKLGPGYMGMSAAETSWCPKQILNISIVS